MMSTFSSQDLLATRISFLNKVRLFVHLREDQLRCLIHDFRLRRYEKDAVIFRQDDHSREMYVILEGRVRVYKISLSGEETSIQIFAVGDIIGELSAIDQQPRSAWAKAIGTCELLEMSGDALLCHMVDMPELALNMARLLAGKLRWTSEYAETIAQYDAAGRLLHILLLYNAQFGRETEDGKHELDIDLTQSSLASMVGARREWVNRILQVWHREGLLMYQSGKVTFLDLEEVQRERDRCLEAGHQLSDWDRPASGKKTRQS